ncbi:branched-chain amino acid ABC transporter permease [Nakamurella alba]|uniref:branched-chain amino acid ABC transporter permease n=1 Tax=Nakamurella alba TaxID=2665158 RepID=UPI0018AABEAA|nr:branched-chain amino acid ABC transporter permease [Nakamurella alba]
MTVVWSGLALGAINALVGIAYNMVLTTSGIFNFAQPQFVMIGAFLAFEGSVVLGLPLWVLLVATAVIGGLLGLLEDQAAIRPLGSGSSHGALVTTVGVSVVMSGAALIIWGTTPRNVPFEGGREALEILGGRILPVELTLLILAVVVAVLLQWGLRRTTWGMAIRAVSADKENARLRGIDVERVRTLGFVVAGAFSMALGPLVVSLVSANVELGNSLVILGFVAAAVGGMGSFVGALIGGLLTGIVQALAAQYIGGQAGLLAVFVLLIVVLVARPTGLFGDRKLRLL